MDGALDCSDSRDDDCKEQEERERRKKCRRGCGRPVNVCLCSALPSQAMDTNTHIFILQHPHEARHKLATVPLLHKCLRNCHVIVGRRLHRGSSSILDNICKSTSQLLLLFPGNEALDLSEWVSSSSSPGMSMAVTQNENNEDKLKWVMSRNENNEEKLNWVVSQSENYEEKLKKVVLVVIDGTWQHAKEMVRASRPFLREIGAIQVCLPYDQHAQGNNMWSCELSLRKEPHGGCLSTMEAVARSLRTLEPTPIAIEVEQKILSVLHAMVAFQVRNLKPMRSRPKLPKKGLCKKEASDDQRRGIEMENAVARVVLERDAMERE